MPSSSVDRYEDYRRISQNYGYSDTYIYSRRDEIDRMLSELDENLAKVNRDEPSDMTKFFMRTA